MTDDTRIPHAEPAAEDGTPRRLTPPERREHDFNPQDESEGRCRD